MLRRPRAVCPLDFTKLQQTRHAFSAPGKTIFLGVAPPDAIYRYYTYTTAKSSIFNRPQRFRVQQRANVYNFMLAEACEGRDALIG